MLFFMGRGAYLGCISDIPIEVIYRGFLRGLGCTDDCPVEVHLLDNPHDLFP